MRVCFKMNQLFKINNDFDGFGQLVKLYDDNKDSWFETINIDFKHFFAANMSAPLAAILDNMTSRLNTISLNINRKLENILQKNGFLTEYGYDDIVDDNETTIPYRKFSRTESKNFAHYVEKKLMTRNDMPNMSNDLHMAVLGAITEIFSNSSLHTTTPYIYACGQFFPNKNLLDFTLADFGGGIREKVDVFLNRSISSTDAIKWALIDGNTTKDNIPGGYGLTLLKNIINHNKGFLQIVSDDGFYEFREGNETFRKFSAKFPGTIINLQFKTDDKTSYYLNKEQNKSYETTR